MSDVKPNVPTTVDHVSSSKRKVKAQAIKLGRDDKIYYTVVNLLLGVIMLMIAYPLVYIISSSFSSPNAVSAGRVVLWPVDFSLEGYKAVFGNKDVITGYQNTILYTVLGTAINVGMTMITAYPLANKKLPGRNGILLLFTFTMVFSGGMIPTYMLVSRLGLINTLGAMVVPGAIAVYDLIIAKTFIQTSIPEELQEASEIDGCSHTRYFFSMVLPLSKAIIAVLILFYAIGHWNSYFSAFLYLHDRAKYPLQLILREILIANSIDSSLIVDPEVAMAKQGMAELLKYALIIVSTVPVMCLYPFVQKYFVKGVMIGSIKG